MYKYKTLSKKTKNKKKCFSISKQITKFVIYLQTNYNIIIIFIFVSSIFQLVTKLQKTKSLFIYFQKYKIYIEYIDF